MSADFEIKRKVLIKYNGKSKNPVIPDGIKKIGENAFETTEIDTVMIPEWLFLLYRNRQMHIRQFS